MYTLKNASGVTKTVKVGFSWTALFFGVFVPIVRGDMKWAAIYGLGSVILAAMTGGLSTFVTNILFAAFYNQLYLDELLDKGYEIV